MELLDLEKVNEASPYMVFVSGNGKSYSFVSDNGVIFVIMFQDDDMLHSGESYQFVIRNKNNARSYKDAKVRDTVLAILRQFFIQNNVAVVYLCETVDGKQALRHRLFQMWFASSSAECYLMRSLTFKTKDGITNYLSLIFRDDNPNRSAIIAEFQEAMQHLSEKPE